MHALRSLAPIASTLVLTLLACGSDPDAAATDGGAGDGPGAADGALPPGDGGVNSRDAVSPDGPTPPAVPTVSSWLGVTISGDAPFVDITHMTAPFDTPAAQLDESGYPVAGASGTSNADLGFLLRSGAYKISYQGTGTLAVSGIGQLAGAWETVGDEHRNVVNITGTSGEFGRFLTLTITNHPGETVTDIHLLSPGFDYGTTEMFVPELLEILAPFRIMRTQGWQNAWWGKLANWADRPRLARFGSSEYGVPYEYLPAIANATGKDLWLHVPPLATDDFVRELARFMRDNLDYERIQDARVLQGYTTPFRIVLEYANEVWTSSSDADPNNWPPALRRIRDVIAADRSYDGAYTGTYGPSWMTQWTELMQVGRVHADLLVKMAGIFREEFAVIGRQDLIAPVLGGWAIGAGYSDVGLQWIRDHYGPPGQYITYVATAPYFGPADDTSTGDLASLFTACSASIQGTDTVYADFARLVAEHGVLMAGYEGGQGLSGTTNQTIKHLAQHDARMHAAYIEYFTQWKEHFGEALFLHFALAGSQTPEYTFQWGYWWGLTSVFQDPATCAHDAPTLTGTEAISSVTQYCPKYQALLEQVPD
jgi:hypothetical protein